MAGTDVGVNLAAGVLTNLMTTVARQARYCYKFNTIVEDLDDEQNNLRLAKESMQVQVRKARANTHEPSKVIQKQFKRAEDLLEEANKLKTKAEASKTCCNAILPNWICRYIVGKQVARLTEEMKQLNGNLGQKLLSTHRQSLQPMRTSEDLIFLESREEVFSNLLMALKDDEKTRIGLYGMGGCGKTSFLKVVQESIKDLNLIDKVAYAVVSNHPKISSIQQDIANWLGLNFETETRELIRATRLSMGFAEDKKYLIILDDVWQVLKFNDIGIPLHKNCKVLISTRLRQICTLMDCQEVIHLSLLTEGEAWDLFQRHAGVIEDDVVAKEITNECYRLPVAIKAVPSTLKERSISMWKEALETLKDHRPLDIEKGMENPYRCLKLSVDYLEGEVRSLFLLCALFPEDSKIAMEGLVRFAFGLGIFEDVCNSYRRTRSRVGVAIEKIKKYSLLLQAEGQIIEMHDLVRDVALWVENEKAQVIRGAKQNLKELTKKDYWKDTRRLCLHDVNEFPDKLNCPELEVLFVSSGGRCSSELQGTFFEETIELKVLVMTDASIWTNPNLLLPKSIKELKKLRTLCLKGWALNNISILGSLNMLDTLQLSYCVVQELPNELSKLTKLKLLEVSGCRIGGNPFAVLATICCHLEELYFVENNLLEMVKKDHIVELFHQIGHSEKLQRYHLEIGECIDTLKDNSRSKFISINDFDVSSTNEAIQHLAQNLEVLHLEKIGGDYKSIFPGMIWIGERMIKLTEILLCEFNNIECLIDITNQLYKDSIVFRELLKLKVEAMNRMEALCRGPTPPGLFEKLKECFIIQCSQLVSIEQLKLFRLEVIQLEDCPKLISLFTTATAQNMVFLEKLRVTNCDKLKHIIEDERGDDIISAEPVLPNLRKVTIKRCEQLECIIQEPFASGLSKLESLKIEDARELKCTFGKRHDGGDQHKKQNLAK